MVELVCVLLGAGGVFSVDLDLGQLVDKLKDVIKAKLQDLVPCAAMLLELYLSRQGDTWLQLTTTDIHALQQGRSVPVVETMLVDRDELHPASRLHEHFGKAFAPQSRDIHVLVKLPKTKKRPFAALTEAATTDGSAQWLASFRNTFVASSALPLMEELPAFVASPLPLKVGIERKQFDHLTLAVGEETCAKLAFVDDSAPCHDLWETVFMRALRPLHGEGTESGFHGHWDSIIRSTIASACRGEVSTNRDTNKSTSSGTQRPDMSVLVDNYCLFRGEEKAPLVDIEIPTNELRDKLDWTYGDTVPYIFGYAASGFECVLYAITSSDLITVNTTKLARYDTSLAMGRLNFVLALLQLCRLFRAIASRCSTRKESFDSVRSNGMVVRLKPTHVVKDFTQARGADGAQLLKIYTTLSEYPIRHLETFVGVSACRLQFTFTPRGFDEIPMSLADLFRALECVMCALVDLHMLGWMHRDVRWSNVVKYRKASLGWFLVDMASAARSPQQFPGWTYLRDDQHAPEIFNNRRSHTTAVDVWCVGRLIRDWNLRQESMNLWTSSSERNSFLRRLLSHDPKKRPTAEQALQTLQRLPRE